MDTTRSALSLHFSPLLDTPILFGLALLGFILVVLSVWRARHLILRRVLMLIIFLIILSNPSILEEERKGVKDIGFVVVDESASQSMEKRQQRRDEALTYIKSTLEKNNQIELRIIHAPADKDLSSETKLFTALDNEIATIPQKQRAGVVFLTDGQIHDIPQNKATYKNYGPIHTLLTGSKNDKDRQIILTKAPAYGLVGKDVTITYKIDDTKNIKSSQAEVTLTMHDGKQMGMMVPTNIEQTLILKLDHPGENVFSLEVEGVDGELTLANNKTAILVNGVRDRLKVLLVSGIPHTGERPWRDLLTADPGVDLVHFTILRSPEKLDMTPPEEMSLIAFPVRELFEEKLNDFDLIIFDHYHQNNLLPDYYFENIVNYIKQGGAFLEASGPSFAGDKSLYSTPMQNILPAQPTGEIITRPFKPKLTQLGDNHPVTAQLEWNNHYASSNIEPNWGSWLRQIDILPKHGDVLMTGADKRPLVLLDRVEKGRVAQIASDHLWLWSRGYDGGGPHTELLRRIVHWLMKEPELDERALHTDVQKNIITVKKQNLGNIAEESISVKSPEGDVTTLSLKSNNEGWLTADLITKEKGIYVFEDASGYRKIAIVGALNPQEMNGVKTTADKMLPLTQASGGTTIWLEDTPRPSLRTLSERSSHFGGNNWLAFRNNNESSVIGAREIPIMPEWAKLLLLIVMLGLLWWREGKQN